MREGRTGQSGAAFLFATLLVFPFFAGPLTRFWFFDPHANASSLATVIWIAAFPVAGALAGYVIAGRRAPLAFAAAFSVIVVAANLALSASISFHDRWRHYENALDLMLYGMTYPLAFAAMGAAGGLIAARDRKVALASAKAFGLGGFIGGFFFCSVIAFHIRGYSELALFIASLAIPAYFGALRFQSVVH